MMIFKLFGRGLLFCAALTLPGCLFHRPSYYSAQVSIKDGAPCFSVGNTRKEMKNPPEISFISVNHIENEKINPIWQKTFSPDQIKMRLSPHDCLAYGVKTEEIQNLRQGLHHEVYMNAYINGNNRRYHAYFCLYETNKGGVGVHQAEWNKKIGGRDWRMCDQ